MPVAGPADWHEDWPFHLWQGASGRWYVHSVLPLSLAATWDRFACTYILARRHPDGLFMPLHIGETCNLAARLRAHDHLAEAFALGLSHVHVHVTTSALERIAAETDLRRSLRVSLGLPDLGRDPHFALTATAGSPGRNR